MSTLEKLVKIARRRPAISRAERAEQRINFAFGQGAIGNPRITKDGVRKVAQKMEDERKLISKK